MIGKPSYRSLTFTQECSFQRQDFFFVVRQHWCKANFFQSAGSNYKSYWSHAGEIKRKVNCGIFLLNLTLLGFPHIKKVRLWSMVKSTWKIEFYPWVVFSTRAQGSVMPSKNLTLSRIDKDELKDLQIFLIRK